ncbi:MAG TPA: nucleoside phosphorylase [Candidatus Dietzia intestinigallinarum]|nr:nucleoside phosphorylase [Candidatus Dietzia intestinigallinarum]
MDGVELIGTVDPAHPLVVVALEQEARHFVTDFPVLVTGVGKVRAALAVAHALAGGARPRELVNVGTAGGLHPGMEGTHEIGVVFQHDFDDPALHAVTGRHDGPPLELSATRAVTPTPRPLAPTAPGGTVAPVLATGDRFVAGGPLRDRLVTMADLVDMEGYAVAAAGATLGVPTRLVKHVSDPADEHAGDTWVEGVDACSRVLAEWVGTRLG